MRLAAIPLLGMLCACQHTPAETNGPGECAVTPAVADMAGERATDTLVREAQRLSRAAVVRQVRPGQVVTTEFNPARLTIEADGRGMVTRIACG